MKRLLMAITLACVLSGTALAGEMPGVVTDPAPEATPEIAMRGDMPRTGYASPGDMSTGGLSVMLTMLDLVF